MPVRDVVMRIYKWYVAAPCRLNDLLPSIKYNVMHRVLLMPPVHYIMAVTVTTVLHISSSTQTV